MTHLWKVSDFQAEIQHLAKLVEKRPSSQVVETMTTTLCSKISAVDIWTTQAIVTMLEEVEAHHFPADLATKLNAAIEKLEPVTGAPVRLSKASQVINNLPAWLTAKDWTRMASNVTIQDQLQVVAQRLLSMGVSSLRENTKCQAVAIVLHQQHCLGKPELQPHAIHSLLGDIQALHQDAAMGKAGGAPACQVYPNDPNQLGSQWLAKCYGQETPECRTIPLAAMMKKA